MLDAAKAILAAAPDQPTRLVPCVVKFSSPLVVTLNGADVQGVAVAGLAYPVGPAVALWSPPSAPVIFPVA